MALKLVSARSAGIHGSDPRRRARSGALVLALTGVRFCELRRLRVRDVASLPYPGLVVKRSVPQSGLTGAVIERATTKSGRSRMVPLSDLRRVVGSSGRR